MNDLHNVDLTMAHSDLTITAGSTDVYTVSSPFNPSDLFTSDTIDLSGITVPNKISLNGDDADIEINGVGLSARLSAIEERLNILNPNLALEDEWQQLKELGDRYRSLEQELKEKSQAWESLKKKSNNKA